MAAIRSEGEHSVSPRQAPSRHDATARQFLDAAVRLIDAYLDDGPRDQQPARLRSIRFPAALDWLRTEDVIRFAGESGETGLSRKAFFNRWPTREEFLPDALVYALVYDQVPEPPNERARQMPAAAAAAAPFSDAVASIADGLLDSLRRHPRSYLTLHIGPLLPQHPQLWEALLPAMRQGVQVWADGYAALMADLGLVLRPGWTPQRLSLALQAALDGFLLRSRIQPEDYPESRWEGAGLFADTVVAILLGVLDVDRSGRTGRAVLDQLVGRPDR
jgi:AcrR family transcriptional regulator